MIRGFYLTTLFALVLSFATSASAQVTLKFKFPDGRKSTMEVKVKSAQTLTLAGMDLESGSDQTITLTTTNGKHAADGTINVTSTTDAVKAAITLPGGTELEFDSANPDAYPPGTQFDFVLDIFKATAKAKWTTKIGQNNRVLAVVDREAAFADLPQNLKDTMKGQLDPEYLKIAANDELDKIPTEPVSVGDSWERTNTLRLDSGQRFTFTNKFTYQGSVKQNGKTLEKLVSKTTDIEYSTEAGAPLKVLESNLKIVASSGLILFDVAAGQVILSRSKMQIKGTIKLEVMGMELPGNLDLTMESTVTLK